MEERKPSPDRKRDIDRRSFLKLSGLLGLGLASASMIPVAAEAVKFNRNHYKVSKTRLAMGTFVSMTLIHPSRDKAEEAMGLAFDEINRLTALMSRFDDATAVAQLNREGFLKDVPPEIADVVTRALGYYRATNGAFDISVKPVVDLFQQSFAGGTEKEPTDAQISKVLEQVGGNKIELDGRTIRFGKPGMGITLDGIAKGFIVDKASRLLANRGIENHLINAGGDIRTSGRKDDGRPWTIAIEDPKKRQHFPDVIQLSDGAVATSGNYEVFYDREKIFYHIVNPFTGHSPLRDVSVSVIAPTTTDADALATGVFVMDPDQGVRFINSRARCECFILDREGNKYKSTGWKSAKA